MKRDPYSFVFRGILADQSTRNSLRGHGFEAGSENEIERIRTALPFDELDGREVERARAMGPVYEAVASVERMMRRFVAETLADKHGEDWWASKVSVAIKKKADGRMEKEKAIKYHGTRGSAPIEYADFGDLAKIVQSNWADFEDFLPSQDWMLHISDALENSRNVIMHSGELELVDVERVGMNIRDWIRQTGT